MKRKKKKSSSSVSIPKTESTESKSSTNSSYKTDGIIGSFSHDSFLNCSDITWRDTVWGGEALSALSNPYEVNTSSLYEMNTSSSYELNTSIPYELNTTNPYELHTINPYYELSTTATDTSNVKDYLDRTESPISADDLEFINHFQQFALEEPLEEKNERCDIEFEKQDTIIVSSNNLCSNGTSFGHVGPFQLPDITSLAANSSNGTEGISSISTRRGDNNLSEDIDDEFEWEKLLEDGFHEFEFQNTAHKEAMENIKASSKSANNEIENSDCSIIEIYGFPEEFKTQDLLVPFSSFINRGFKLKWVDNTHALGIFPTPSIAEEALNSPLPFIKTRPLSLASPASKEKAQRVSLPPTLRPKTCSALARRLVSGALGMRAVFTKEEREAEKEMLKEAREQKKLAAKQREAAWEGKF